MDSQVAGQTRAIRRLYGNYTETYRQNVRGFCSHIPDHVYRMYRLLQIKTFSDTDNNSLCVGDFKSDLCCEGKQ